jgi:hypothetical protein
VEEALHALLYQAVQYSDGQIPLPYAARAREEQSSSMAGYSLTSMWAKAKARRCEPLFFASVKFESGHSR